MPSYADLYQQRQSSSHSPVLPPSNNGYAEDGWTIRSTIRRIEGVVNEDVVMQAPLSELTKYLVVDTNILLGGIDVLQRFVTDVERLGAPVIVIIPGIVILELDNQKTRSGLEWHARRASTWLLAKVKERRHVKGQMLNETLKPSKNWKSKSDSRGGMHNDDLILDCAQFFNNSHTALLASNDKNLCFLAESDGIRTLSLVEGESSSRDIARALYQDHEAVPHFSDDEAVYRTVKQSQDISSRSSKASKQGKRANQATHAPTRHTDLGDSMDVDDDASDVPSLPSHPLDLLHIQVVEHFTRLLCDLAMSVVPAQKEDNNRSMHATPNIVSWNAQSCIEYLDAKRKRKGTFTSPRLEIFLKERYSGGGARPGQEWPKGAWLVCMKSLEDLGELWQEHVFSESVQDLRPHVEGIFSMPIRPTGT